MRSFTFLFWNSFMQNYRFLYHGDEKISRWRICRWQAVNLEIIMCSSGVNWDCILAIDQHPVCPIRARRELWPRKWVLLGWNPWRGACRYTSRSMSLKMYVSLIVSTDLWPKRYLLFLDMIAMVASESSFNDFICLRRPAGLLRGECCCQVCVITVTLRLWADVGLCCVSWRKFLSLCLRPPLQAWPMSQAVSQTIAFSSLSGHWEIQTSFTFFHFLKLVLCFKWCFLYVLLYHGD